MPRLRDRPQAGHQVPGRPPRSTCGAGPGARSTGWQGSSRIRECGGTDKVARLPGYGLGCDHPDAEKPREVRGEDEAGQPSGKGRDAQRHRGEQAGPGEIRALVDHCRPVPNIGMHQTPHAASGWLLRRSSPANTRAWRTCTRSAVSKRIPGGDPGPQRRGACRVHPHRRRNVAFPPAKELRLRPRAGDKGRTRDVDRQADLREGPLRAVGALGLPSSRRRRRPGAYVNAA